MYVIIKFIRFSLSDCWRVTNTIISHSFFCYANFASLKTINVIYRETVRMNVLEWQEAKDPHSVRNINNVPSSFFILAFSYTIIAKNCNSEIQIVIAAHHETRSYSILSLYSFYVFEYNRVVRQAFFNLQIASSSCNIHIFQSFQYKIII